MKKNVKSMISCLITILLTIYIIYMLGVLVRPTNTDIAFNTINTFHDMPEESFEVIGYGSSHMWNSMDPIVLYKEFGIGAFNYGCNWQNINTTLLFLKDSLRTQSPKVVLIETYNINCMKIDMDMDGEIYYTRAIDEFDGKQEYLKQCFGDDFERYLSYYVPLCAFHSNWKDLEPRNFMKNGSSFDFYKTMGFRTNNETTTVTIDDPSSFEQAELSNEAVKILDEIVSICKENDIDIIFYTAPYRGPYEYGNATAKYAAENDCTYFNLFEYIEQIGIDGKTDFCDSGHLNSCGAEKVTYFLGEYVVNNYSVNDMRNIENNIWEQALQR